MPRMGFLENWYASRRCLMRRTKRSEVVEVVAGGCANGCGTLWGWWSLTGILKLRPTLFRFPVSRSFKLELLLPHICHAALNITTSSNNGIAGELHDAPFLQRTHPCSS